MRLTLRLAGCVALVSFSCGLAAAQTTCPAGRAADGHCANAALTSSMQQRAIIFTQPRVSYTGPPTAFGDNSYADAARDRQSLANGIDSPVLGQNAAAPAPGTFIGLPSGVNPSSLNIAAPYTVVPGGIRIR